MNRSRKIFIVPHIIIVRIKLNFYLKIKEREREKLLFSLKTKQKTQKFKQGISLVLSHLI